MSRYCSLPLVCTVWQATGEYPFRKNSPRMSCVIFVIDVHEEGYPYLVRFELLLFLSRSPARSMLSSVIDTVNSPYANATATTQETVSRVSSLNFSSIDEDGELFLSSCSGGGCCNAPLPSLFPHVAYGQMHGKQRTGLDGVHRDSGQTWPRSSRP